MIQLENWDSQRFVAHVCSEHKRPVISKKQSLKSDNATQKKSLKSFEHRRQFDDFKNAVCFDLRRKFRQRKQSHETDFCNTENCEFADLFWTILDCRMSCEWRRRCSSSPWTALESWHVSRHLGSQLSQYGQSPHQLSETMATNVAVRQRPWFYSANSAIWREARSVVTRTAGILT